MKIIMLTFVLTFGNLSYFNKKLRSDDVQINCNNVFYKEIECLDSLKMNYLVIYLKDSSIANGDDFAVKIGQNDVFVDVYDKNKIHGINYCSDKKIVNNPPVTFSCVKGRIKVKPERNNHISINIENAVFYNSKMDDSIVLKSEFIRTKLEKKE